MSTVRAVGLRAASALAALLAAASPAMPLGCAGSEPVAAASPEPAPARLEELLPGDADLVARVDLERVRAVLSLPPRALEPGLVDARAEPGLHAWLADRLDRARFATLAFGARPPGEAPSFACALTGETFERSAPPGFGAPRALGDGLVARARGAAGSGGDLALVVEGAGRGVLVASRAAAPAVEARAAGRGLAPLEPTLPGVLSVSVRPAALGAALARRAPSTAALLGRATRLDAAASIGEAGLGLELDLRAPPGAALERLEALAGELVRALSVEPGLLGELARGATVERVADHVVLRARLGASSLGRLADCLLSGAAC